MRCIKKWKTNAFAFWTYHIQFKYIKTVVFIFLWVEHFTQQGFFFNHFIAHYLNKIQSDEPIMANYDTNLCGLFTLNYFSG